MTLAIDPNGSAIGHYQQNSGTSANITISTTNSNDVVILDFTDNTSFSPAIVSSTTLTFTKRVQLNLLSSTTFRFYAIATSPLTNETITMSGLNNGFTRGTAFAVSGANTSSSFDSGGPVTSTTGPDPLSITTVNANTMVIGYYTCNTPTSPGSGFTTINSQSGDFAIEEYKILSVAGTTSVTIGSGGVGTASSGIIDAIVQASAGGDNLVGEMPMIHMKRKSLGWTPPLIDHRRRQWRRNRSLLIPLNKLWTPKRKLAA